MKRTKFRIRQKTLVGAQYPWRILVVTFASSVLLACAGTQAKLFPTKVEASISTSQDVNPDASGRPSPIVVRFYELKTNTVFNSGDFFTLYNNEAATLGSELVARDEFEMVPDQHKEISRTPHQDTRFIGVVAAYRNLGQAQWRKVVELKPNKTNNITVNLQRLAVTITAE